MHLLWYKNSLKADDWHQRVLVISAVFAWPEVKPSFWAISWFYAFESFAHRQSTCLEVLHRVEGDCRNHI